MNQDDQNWKDVSNFFTSQLWEDICDDAIKHDDQPSNELMNDILIRFQSAVFYAQEQNLTRFNKEISDLATITKHLTNTL